MNIAKSQQPEENQEALELLKTLSSLEAGSPQWWAEVHRAAELHEDPRSIPATLTHRLARDQLRNNYQDNNLGTEVTKLNADYRARFIMEEMLLIYASMEDPKDQSLADHTERAIRETYFPDRGWRDFPLEYDGVEITSRMIKSVKALYFNELRDSGTLEKYIKAKLHPLFEEADFWGISPPDDIPPDPIEDFADTPIREG